MAEAYVLTVWRRSCHLFLYEYVFFRQYKWPSGPSVADFK